MLSRNYFIGKGQYTVADRSSTTTKQASFSGWLIMVLLSAGYAVWLIYRWQTQPGWLEILPSFFNELLDLIEMAVGMTLILLWAGLTWRQYRRLNRAPSQHLSKKQLFKLSPKAFEHYVADLFRQKGYRVVVRGKSGDHGVDLELFGSGHKRAIVQCKRYRDTVGEVTVRDLYGTLLHERASRAFLVTTADISDAARLWASGKPITLIDGDTLVDIATSLAAVREESHLS
jgi:restriction system protein